MSIEPDREQIFQYATFGVIGLTVVICLCFGLIFFNPALNPIAALRPLQFTPTIAAIALPATWTPTRTYTPTNTPTFTPTSTPTAVPTNTPIPTNTVPPTLTPLPTRPPATARPTQRPPGPGPQPTARPATATPYVANQRFIGIKKVELRNCNQWFIHGTVWQYGQNNGFMTGTLVQLWVNGAPHARVAAGTGSFAGVSPGYYEFDFAKGSSGTGSIAIVDANGTLLSPQYSIRFTKTCNKSGDVNEIIGDFALQQ